MPQESLNGANVIAVFEKMGRKGMTQRVHAGWFNNLGGTYRIPYRLLNRRIRDVMASHGAGSRVLRTVGRGKDVLPAPLAVGIRGFLLQRLGPGRGPQARCRTR